MGEEIQTSFFKPKDFEDFQTQLRAETSLLRQWFDEKAFTLKEPKVGFELEAWLVNKRLVPAPVNEAFLEDLNNPCVVHELSKFNVELNTSPFVIFGKVFSDLKTELERLWERCQQAAQPLGAQMVMIGMLPTLKPKMLSLDNMTDSKRYEALNEQVFQQRNGIPISLDVQGEDRLQMVHDNVLLEATATSLQIHFNVPLENSVSYYNASLILSPAMVGLAANSPFLFGKRLWDESRIPVFEQAVNLDQFSDQNGFPVGRVSFGSGFLKNSFFELFQENLERFTTLLPIRFEEPKDQLRHLRLHNGTIWRWNRPLIGWDKDGSPQLRIEHRVAAAGPSIPDVIANTAFFVGALQFYTHQKIAPETLMDYSKVRNSFYEAARHGLEAKVAWRDKSGVSLKEILLNELIPNARKGLKDLGVGPDDVKFFLDGIIEKRVQTGQNGATWQRRWLDKFSQDFKKVTEAYIQNQKSGAPVHEWS